MDLDLLEKAILLLEKHQLSEMTYETEAGAFSIKKEAPTISLATRSESPENPYKLSPIENSEPVKEKSNLISSHVLVKASLVGTFYRATDPNSAPLCAQGQMMKKGEPLGLIEAMKVLTVIAAPCSGLVVDIFVENGQVVEYDQILFQIQP